MACQNTFERKQSFNEGSVGEEPETSLQLGCPSPHHDDIEFKENFLDFHSDDLSFAYTKNQTLESYGKLNITSPPNDDTSVITHENNCRSEGYKPNGTAPKKGNAWTPLVECEKTGSLVLLYGKDPMKGKPEEGRSGHKKLQFRDHVWKYAQMYRAESGDLEEDQGNNKRGSGGGIDPGEGVPAKDHRSR